MNRGNIHSIIWDLRLTIIEIASGAKGERLQMDMQGEGPAVSLDGDRVIDGLKDEICSHLKDSQGEEGTYGIG